MKMGINGALIHYRREGTGFPILTLHAGVADSRMWQPQVDDFAKHFDVIRPDMRGFGDSELPAGSWAPRGDLLGLMGQLGLQTAALVGWSVGGAPPVGFSVDHPARGAKVVPGGVAG